MLSLYLGGRLIMAASCFIIAGILLFTRIRYRSIKNDAYFRWSYVSLASLIFFCGLTEAAHAALVWLPSGFPIVELLYLITILSSIVAAISAILAARGFIPAVVRRESEERIRDNALSEAADIIQNRLLLENLRRDKQDQEKLQDLQPSLDRLQNWLKDHPHATG